MTTMFEENFCQLEQCNSNLTYRDSWM